MKKFIYSVASAALLVGIVTIAPRSLSAAPSTALGTLHVAPSMVETIGYWRRYCQLHDCIGNARPEADVGVGVHAPVVPVAPLAGHCGEYHYLGRRSLRRRPLSQPLILGPRCTVRVWCLSKARPFASATSECERTRFKRSPRLSRSFTTGGERQRPAFCQSRGPRGGGPFARRPHSK